MKRNRAECPPISRFPADAPAKTKRPQKDASPKAAARARAAATMTTDKLRKGGLREEEENTPPANTAAAVAGAEYSYLPEAAAVDRMWDVCGEEFGGWWWWGAEEEKLLGWFPFAAEHFLGSGERRGDCFFWGDEEEEEDRDIWQLQHIHEIPNRAK